MIYYAIYEPAKYQIFDIRWTSSKIIIEDIDKIMRILGIDDLDDFEICSNDARFKIRRDTTGNIRLVFNGRHFFCDVNGRRSFTMLKSDYDDIRQLFSNSELNEYLGYDINS